MNLLEQQREIHSVQPEGWAAPLFGYLHRCFEMVGPGEERFHVVFLDSDRNCRDDCIMSCGSSLHLPVRLRDVFTRALCLNASGIVVAHNHPSGDCRPSESDLKATRRLRDIGRALDIELLDHLIFTREKVYSMRAGGKL